MPRSKGHSVHTHRTHGGRLSHLEHQFSDDETVTDVEEVWFAGCHCGTCVLLMLFRDIILMSIYADIGGGSVVNGTRNSLARIPLRWMIRQCFLANTGIMFHKDTLPKVGLDPNTLFPQVLPRPPMIFQDPKVHTIPVPKPLVVCDDRKAVVYTDGGSFVNEAEEDLADALSPMYDQLKLAKYWWILEMMPTKIQYQSSETDLMVSEIKYVDLYFVSLCVIKMDIYCCLSSLYRVNMGRPRYVALQKKNGIKIHRSVKIRMEAEGIVGVKEKYLPRVNIKVEPTWVD